MGQVRKRCHPTASAACDAEEARNARGRPSVVAHLLPSHGRGHWFDPSTAHHKSMTYLYQTRKVRHKYGINLREDAWSGMDPSGRVWTTIRCRHCAALQ